MNRQELGRIFVGLKADNRALRVALLILVLSNVLLAWRVLVKSEIVTVIPSNAMAADKYTNDGADPETLSNWGVYVATLLGNVTPSSADFASGVLGKLLAPDIYQQVMDDMAKQVTKIKVDQLTLTFAPSDVKFDSNRNIAYVSGWLATTDAHGSQAREERTYEIWFKVVAYQPRIVGLSTYPGKPKGVQ
ncbi:MAG: TraE/TraK family type IV conjugative transfer system protein [Rhodanobacter sp.]